MSWMRSAAMSTRAGSPERSTLRAKLGTGVLACAALALLLPAAAAAATTVTVAPLTWGVMGLDSNDVTLRGRTGSPGCGRGSATPPRRRPRTCASFVWDSANSLINNRTGTLHHDQLPHAGRQHLRRRLLRGGDHPELRRVRHDAAVPHRGDRRWRRDDRKQPDPARIYVEHLISQNRNHVTDLQLSSDGVNYNSISAGGALTLAVGTRTGSRSSLRPAPRLLPAARDVRQLPEHHLSDAERRQHLYGEQRIGVPGPALRRRLRVGVESPQPQLPGLQRQRQDRWRHHRHLQGVDPLGTGCAAAQPRPLSTLVYDNSGSSFHYNADTGTGTGPSTSSTRRS